MKKLLIWVLFCVLLVGGVACQGIEQQKTASYTLYFQERDLSSVAGAGALRAVSTVMPELESVDTQQAAERLLRRLMAGTEDETLKVPIPSGTELMSLRLNGGQAVVDFSGAYGTLSGVNLTLADYAITLTLTQLPEITSVKITVLGQELGYRDQQVFTGREILLAPEGDVVGTVTVTLYFINAEGALSPEERTLKLYEGDTQVSVVARALEDGPASKELTSVFPKNFQIKSVWMEEAVCYVNIPSTQLELLSPEGNLSVVLEALDRSLCSLETVRETRFLVDGQFTQIYGQDDENYLAKDVQMK